MNPLGYIKLVVNKIIMPTVTFLLLHNECMCVIGKNLEMLHEERKREKQLKIMQDYQLLTSGVITTKLCTFLIG